MKTFAKQNKTKQKNTDHHEKDEDEDDKDNVPKKHEARVDTGRRDALNDTFKNALRKSRENAECVSKANDCKEHMRLCTHRGQLLGRRLGLGRLVCLVCRRPTGRFPVRRHDCRKS